MSNTYIFHKKSCVYLIGLMVAVLLLLITDVVKNGSLANIYSSHMTEVCVFIFGFIEIFTRREIYAVFNRVKITINPSDITFATETFFSGLRIEIIPFKRITNVTRLFYDGFGIEIEYNDNDDENTMKTVKIHGLKNGYLFFKEFYDSFGTYFVIFNDHMIKTRNKIRKIEQNLKNEKNIRFFTKFAIQFMLLATTIYVFVKFDLWGSKNPNFDGYYFFSFCIFMIFLSPIFIFPSDLD